MPTEDDEPRWYADHANLSAMAQRMSDEGDSMDDVIYMLLKPWKYEPEWIKIQSEWDGEAAARADLRETETM